MIQAIERAIKEDEFDLNEWEENFLSSISRRANSGEALTDRQESALDTMWKKATGQ